MTINCLGCGAPASIDGRYCDRCGAALARCRNCGSANRPAATYCNHCGRELLAREIEDVARRAERPSNRQAAPFVSATRQKWITVLFADIRGSTELVAQLDPEAAMERLDPATSVMEDAVLRCGGVVNLRQGDGIMALFGVPLACEDHAVRACRAAQTMIEGIAELRDATIAIRIGLDSGKLVVRQTGVDASDYDAIGPVAHVASRLEQRAAPGTVLLSGRVMELVRGHTEIEASGLVKLRGLTEPVNVYRLVSVAARPRWDARSAVGLQARFIGREAELALLLAASDGVGPGRGQAVTIVAEAGVGKSRLIHEFLLTLEASGRRVLRASGLPHTTGVPYAAAADVLRSWLHIEPGASREDLTCTLDHCLSGSTIEPLRAPLRSLLALPEEDEQWAALAPPDRRNRIITAFLAVIRESAMPSGLTLVLDDYHWIDRPSAGCFEALFDDIDLMPLLVIAAARPESRPAWAGDPGCREMTLAPLGKADADSLLRDLIGSSDRWASLRRRIVDRAEGIPLYLEEIARALAESGSASGSIGATSLLDNVLLEVPASVQAIITSRIDRLPAATREVLELCSIIGRVVPYDILQATADASSADLMRELATLEVAGFLNLLASSVAIHYAFNHAMVQSVAYDGMLSARRRELHRLVLAEMEQSSTDRLEETIELRASHARRGEEWALAARLALTAGDNAASRWAWREAVRFYEDAIVALQSLEQTRATVELAIEARLRLRIALPTVGDLPRIACCLDQARELAAGLGSDAVKLAAIDVSRCLALTKLGSLQAAIEAGRSAQRTAIVEGEPRLCLNANFALAQAHWYRGEFGLAQALVQEQLTHIRGALRLQQTGTTGTASVLALVCLAKTFAITGQIASAEATALEAYEVAGLTGKPFDLSYANIGLGFTRLMSADFTAAITTLEAALGIARKGDLALLVPSSLRYLGRVYVEVGRWKDAQVILEEAVELTTECKLLGMRLWSTMALGVLQVEQRQTEAAETTLLSVLDVAHRNGFRPVEAQVMRVLGKLSAAGAGPRGIPVATWSGRAAILADSLGMAWASSSAMREIQAAAPVSPRCGQRQ